MGYNIIMTTTQTITEYLAIYTGPGGPITAIFAADSLGEAIDIAAASAWYDDARTDLDDVAGVDLLGADAKTVHATAVAQGWTRVHAATTDRDYAIYAKPGDVDSDVYARNDAVCVCCGQSDCPVHHACTCGVHDA